MPVGDACRSWVAGGTGLLLLPKWPLLQSQWRADPPSSTPCSTLAVVGSAWSHPLPHSSASPILSALCHAERNSRGLGRPCLPSCTLPGHSVPIVLSSERCPGPGKGWGIMPGFSCLQGPLSSFLWGPGCLSTQHPECHWASHRGASKSAFSHRPGPSLILTFD